MRRAFIAAAFGVGLLTAGSTAYADTFTLSGYLDDAANTALVASDGYMDLKPARFGSDDEIARNVALYELNVTTGGTFSFASFGYAALGAEPYFTLFAGSGLLATLVDSSGLSDPLNVDFSFSRALGPGVYTLALGLWLNMSFAENNPDGDPSLGDAFTALGVPGLLGNYYYELEVASDDGEFDDPVPAGDIRNEPIPEPSMLLLLACGASGALVRFRRRQR
jgi:hypothetical protein